MVARVSRHRFAQEPPRSDDSDRLFNTLPPVASSPSTSLPASFLERKHVKERKAKEQGEGKGKGRGALTAFVVVVDPPLMAGDKHPRDEESSTEPCGLPRAHHEFFQGRYFPALSSSFRPCILFCCVHDDTCVVVGCRRRVPERVSPGKAALGRRVILAPPSPLRPAGTRCGVALGRLVLSPAARLQGCTKVLVALVQNTNGGPIIIL